MAGTVQRSFLFGAAVLVAAMGDIGCDKRREREPKIRLASTHTKKPGRDRESQPAFKLAIASVWSPERSVTDYWPLKIYLASRLKQPVELIFRKTYGETNELLRVGAAQAGIICSGAYVRGKEKLGLELLAAPFTRHGQVYHSYIIVRADSQIERFEQLRGRSFAFMDPLSNSGCLFPRYLLAKMGRTADSFFSRYFFTHSHDNSMKAVAERLADGAAVDSLVYDQLVAEARPPNSDLKVILKSPPFGISPLVVGPRTPKELRGRLRGVLLGMDTDPQAAAALAALGIQGFRALDDAAYDSIRDMIRVVEAAVPPARERPGP